ncbi:hypothetical protein [Streptomyces lutosisoli]|uniref:Uncharacterized protein n=1 Tax=Streptomyces lutosisoli TaxID=2665721 RepID=A0ABW2VYY7_9ACTN
MRWLPSGVWEIPAASASLRERWAAIAPDLAGHVAAVGYDADSGRLTLCPESTLGDEAAPGGYRRNSLTWVLRRFLV